MREIKFRAWDEIEMREMDELRLPVKAIGWVPLQYTGLKDKNGTEIYDGDIVSYYLHVDSKKPHWTFQVRWISNRNQYGWNVKEGYQSRVEVIGNIYENPELVE